VPVAPRLAGRAPLLHILMVASEAAPWAKTGGLADVVAALPDALAALGHQVTIVMPKYRGITAAGAATSSRTVRFGIYSHDVTFHALRIDDRRRLVFVERPSLFDRDGLYGTGGRDYEDNAERFALLAFAALEFGDHDDVAPRANVLHAHDWQGGLALALLRRDPQRWPGLAAAGLVFTIHNLAYQGLFPHETVPRLGLPWDLFTVERGEFWGRFSLLKAGITASDYVTTVSPTYAKETLTPAFGAGMEGVLAARGDRYIGILNGIDSKVWNPESDPFLPAHFSMTDDSGKTLCKRALLDRFGLPLGDDALGRPVIALISRLVDQKGLDLVEAASGALLELDATWIFLGTGEARYESLLRRLAERHPSRVGTFIGFNEPLAHLVEAGADMFLMPSRFEPCGLNQMYSLRYGTVPIVHAVGGLEDTVQPFTSRALNANGFKFRDASPEELVRVVRQAVRVYHDRPVWRRLMLAGMSSDHSWGASAREYVKVYRRARLDAAQRMSPLAPGA
jgi:starch synthase